ncbi:MAG: hypothetical protein ACTHOB_16330 [Ginsengibacter sp.]
MYTLIKPPLFANKTFFDFTKDEAKEYLQWFLSIKDERLIVLEFYVKKAYPEWQANYSEESLIDLYKWFEKQVAYRKVIEEEKKEIENQISKTPLFTGIIPIPQFTFTDETVSVCFDSAIYIGEVLINKLPKVKWLQKLNSKNYIDYAQPLIGEKGGKVPVNPRRVVESIARRILDKDEEQISFEIVYEKWFKKFKHNY